MPFRRCRMDTRAHRAPSDRQGINRRRTGVHLRFFPWNDEYDRGVGRPASILAGALFPAHVEHQAVILDHVAVLGGDLVLRALVILADERATLAAGCVIQLCELFAAT